MSILSQIISHERLDYQNFDWADFAFDCHGRYGCLMCGTVGCVMTRFRSCELWCEIICEITNYTIKLIFQGLLATTKYSKSTWQPLLAETTRYTKFFESLIC